MPKKVEHRVENKEAVRNYHTNLKTLRIRFPAENPEKGVPDYLSMIRDRAKEKGFICLKGADKGQGSVNAYILHLIEQDLGIEMLKGLKDVKAQQKNEVKL